MIPIIDQFKSDNPNVLGWMTAFGDEVKVRLHKPLTFDEIKFNFGNVQMTCFKYGDTDEKVKEFIITAWAIMPDRN